MKKIESRIEKAALQVSPANRGIFTSGATQFYAEGLGDSICEIQEWIDILELNHKKISDSAGYANKIEADREHGNVMAILKGIKYNLQNKIKLESELKGGQG